MYRRGEMFSLGCLLTSDRRWRTAVEILTTFPFLCTFVPLELLVLSPLCFKIQLQKKVNTKCHFIIAIMITQLCFPSCIMHVRISLGAQPHFLRRCNSGDHYYSRKALLFHCGQQSDGGLHGITEASVEGCCSAGLAAHKLLASAGSMRGCV